jgi:hypothetical protein
VSHTCSCVGHTSGYNCNAGGWLTWPGQLA